MPQLTMNDLVHIESHDFSIFSSRHGFYKNLVSHEPF